jgi:hypothetical protein
MSDKDLFEGQGEAAYVHTEVSEVADSVNNATFTPESKIETEMPVDEAEVVQAAFVEVVDGSAGAPSAEISQTNDPESREIDWEPDDSYVDKEGPDRVADDYEPEGETDATIEQGGRVDQVGSSIPKIESEGVIFAAPQQEHLKPLEDPSIGGGLETKTGTKEIDSIEVEAGRGADGPQTTPLGEDLSGAKVIVSTDGDVMKGGSAPPSQAMVTNEGEVDPAQERLEPVEDGSEISPTDTDVIDFTGASEPQLKIVDIQNPQQRLQQALTMMSTISKFMQDSGMGVVRKMGNGSDDETSDDAGTIETGEGSREVSPQEGDTGLATANNSAPFIPGGAVLSAAISGGEVSESDGSSPGEGEVEGGTEESQSAEDTLGVQAGSVDVTAETLEQLISNNSPVDIQAVIQRVIRQSYLESSEDLNDYAEKVKNINAVKKALREQQRVLRDYQVAAATALREQFNAQDVEQEVTLAYSTLEQDIEGEYQLVEKSETLPREEADGLIAQLEETQIGDVKGIRIGLEGMITVSPPPLDEIIEELLPVEILEGQTESDEGTEPSAELVKHYMEMKDHLKNEIALLKDDLMNWPGGQTQTITYTDIEKQSDGKYKKEESTQVFSKEEVKVLIDVLTQKLAALTKDIQLQLLSLQSTKEESDSTTETLGKTAEKQSGTVGAVAKKP